MGSFDPRHIDETGRAADKRAGRKSERRHRLPAAFGDGARAVANPFSAGECISDQRMHFEALKFLERRKIGVAIVKMDDKADRNQIVAEMIDERAAAGAVIERPAERVLHKSAFVFVRRDLPKLLEPDAKFLRFAIGPQPEVLDQYLGQTTARALGEQRVFAAQLHAASKSGFVIAVLGEAHVAGGDSGDGAVFK